MAQETIKIGTSTTSLVEIKQPDMGGLQYSFETTYTEDSTRSQSGKGHFTEMFTVQAFTYSATDITISEMSKILQIIIGQKFYLYTLNPYSGEWETIKCYVGQGDLTVGLLEADCEKFDSLSFQMTAVDPL